MADCSYADLGYETSDPTLSNSLEDIPLASPTTVAAVEQASRNVQGSQSEIESDSGITSAAPPSLEQSQQQAPDAGKWGLPPAPPKPPVFTYVHDDSDTAMSELEEFFS